jgi:hypothetical protein
MDFSVVAPPKEKYEHFGGKERKRPHSSLSSQEKVRNNLNVTKIDSFSET